jgi:PiT family inorganic phosphate transporter
MSPLLILVIFVIVLALAFDYSNGFHDAANSIATIVATRVLRPMQAVAWAAFFNFIAAFTLHTGVAATIGKGTVEKEAVDVYVILACLVGAIGWNVTTWYLGLPSSSSHALVGGLIGAAVMRNGPSAIVVEGVQKTATFIVVSPLVGMCLGIIMMTGASWLLRNAHPGPVNKWARRLQLVSSGFYSLGHGMNDAQKTMGIIAVLLVSMRSQVPELQNAPDWIMPPSNLEHLPIWIILSAHAAIALGTLSGGWRIVKTMGMRITQLQPIGGVCAETAAAITIIGVSLAKIPVSTTHTIAGAIVGVGASRRISAVRWGVAGQIIWAWVLTIPAAAIISALTYLFIQRFWLVLPTVGQYALSAIVAVALGYAYLAWLRSTKHAPVVHH